MVTYTWTITKLDVVPSLNTLSNVVKNVHWMLTLTKEVNNVPYSTTCTGKITLDEPSESSFIAYDQITFENVVSWVENFLGENQVNLLQSDLMSTVDSAISRTNNPPFINLRLPWEPEPPPPVVEVSIGSTVSTGSSEGG